MDDRAGLAAVLIRYGECDQVGPGVFGIERERGAGSIGDRLAVRRDDVPVVGMRVRRRGVDERAGQGDGTALVDRLVRPGGDVQVGGLLAKVTVPEP